MVGSAFTAEGDRGRAALRRGSGSRGRPRLGLRRRCVGFGLLGLIALVPAAVLVLVTVALGLLIPVALLLLGLVRLLLGLLLPLLLGLPGRPVPVLPGQCGRLDGREAVPVLLGLRDRLGGLLKGPLFGAGAPPWSSR